MKALIELEITGDFEEPLSNDGVIDILNAVILDGADSVGLSANYKIIKVGENRPKLSLNVSVKDTEIFKTMLSYTEALIELLGEYPISEVDRRKLNEISGEFFELTQEAEQ
jgi:hypothetical protein